jgi:hypothetical protein
MDDQCTEIIKELSSCLIEANYKFLCKKYKNLINYPEISFKDLLIIVTRSNLGCLIEILKNIGEVHENYMDKINVFNKALLECSINLIKDNNE